MRKKCCKALYAASVLLALTLVAACDLEGKKTTDTPETPFEAPNMGSPSELVASGGAVPEAEEDANTFFKAALAALRESLDVYIPEDTGPFSIQEEGVSITGSVAESYNEKDFQPNKTINDFISFFYSLKLQGTITNRTVTDTWTEESYTISGKVIGDVSFGMGVNVVTGSESILSASMNLSFAQIAGYALSIRRSSDGAGGKFILSYAHRFSRSNVASEEFDPFNLFFGELVEGLQSSSVTLQIFNDSDALIHTITIPLSDIPGNEFSIEGGPEDPV